MPEVCFADKPETRDFLANGYFSKATLAVEIIKVRFGVKYSTTGLITLVILINRQPVWIESVKQIVGDAQTNWVTGP